MPSLSRRLIAVLACAALLAGAGGCGRTDEEKVRDTVSDFAEARQHGDYARVCELFDPTFRSEQGLVLDCAGTLAAQSEGQPAPGGAAIVDVIVNGDKATVALDVSKSGEAPSRQTVNLVLRDGDWMISGTT